MSCLGQGPSNRLLEAILTWIFLGETLTTAKIAPMVMILVGALMVQLRK